MKRKLLLAFFIMVAATATMNAQDDVERTAAPEIEVFDLDWMETTIGYYYLEVHYMRVGITVDEPEAAIYFRYSVDGGEFSEWMTYSNYIYFWDFGEYEFEAYAQADGKLPSDISHCEFSVYSNPTDQLIYIITYDFESDSIYYKQTSDTTVVVCPITTTTMTEPHWSIVPSYSGDVIVPSQVEYEGKSYTVTSVYRFTFSACDVTAVVLPNTITFIDEYAFSVCSMLEKITCYATTPPDVFYPNWSQQQKLFVPLEAIESYKAHEEWGKFWRIVPFIGAGPGDMDGDGVINVKDVTDLIDMLLSGADVPAYCDVDGDGTINVKDLTSLIDMLLSAK